MFAIIVTEKGGDQRRHEYDKSEVTIGRVQGNDVILPKGNVSKRHARIVLKDGKFIIVDLKSTNGTYVNGRKITSPLVVKENDKIYIGDFILGVEQAGAGASPGPLGPPSPPMPDLDAPPADAPPWSPPGPAGAPPSDRGPAAVAPPSPPRRGRPAPPPPAPAPVPPPASPALEPPPRRTAPRPSQPPPLADEPPVPPPPRPGPPSPPKPRVRPRASEPPPPMAAPEPPLVQSAEDEADMVTPPPVSVEPAPAPAPAAPAPAPAPRAPSAPAAAPRPRLVGAGAPGRKSGKPSRPVPSVPRGVSVSPLDPKVVKMLELQAEIQERLLAKLDLDEIAPEDLGDEDLWQRAESAIVDLVETLDSSGEVPNFVDQDALIKESLNEALGLGPLEDLLADDAISEVLVDRRDRIIVGKGGALEGAGKAFSSDAAFQRVVERLVASSGAVIDDSTPLVDLRLRDGTRLTAAIPPVSVRGACLTLRKPHTAEHSLAALISAGSLSGAMGDFLETCVAARKNIVVAGSPGPGKSSVVAALAASAPAGERVVTVEEVAELSIGRDNWIALEARPGDSNGLAPVDLGMVLRSALRMRPDRLVIGDVRGAEALEMLQAMASSSDGAIAAVAGEGAGAALSRLATMARLGAPGLSERGLRELVACAVDVVVHVTTYADGACRVASVVEVGGASDDGIATTDLFAFRSGEGDGGFVPSGAVPAFYAELEARGIPADTSIFR